MNKKFLIGQLACYGDCLYATTIAKQIKHDYPNSHITWAIASKYKSILFLNPFVDDVWEIELVNGDYYDKGWSKFEEEALRKKENGEFDELIFSQIPPLNWINYDGTIRGTILKAYKKPITQSVSPVLKLSIDEIENVKTFAHNNKLSRFKNVILFECSPGSNQSKVTPEFAIQISEKISTINSDTCFILSSPNKINNSNPQIIDASELTFRENAELTKYCSLLIGCSSGITWLSMSDWAKKLPMVQLLDDKLPYFSGIHYDLEINKLDNSKVIEITDFEFEKIYSCIQLLLINEFKEVKKEFHQNYKPRLSHLYTVTNNLVSNKYSLLRIFKFAVEFKKTNTNRNNKIDLNFCKYTSIVYDHYLEKNYPEIDNFDSIWKPLKIIFRKKQHRSDNVILFLVFIMKSLVAIKKIFSKTNRTQGNKILVQNS